MYGDKLANNFRYMDPVGDEQDECSGESALKELLNVICGLYVSMGDSSVDVRLGLPRCTSLNRDEWLDVAGDPHTVMLLVESMPIAAQVKDA